MSKGKLFGILAGMVSLILVIGLFSSWVTTTNKEKRLRNLFNAEVEVTKSTFDKMWKILQEQAGVADQYRDAFDSIFVRMTDARYQDGGELLKFVTESNPEFKIDLYKNVQVEITAQRTTFFEAEKKMTDIKRQHDDMRVTFPSSIWVGGVEELKVPYVRSGRTDKAYETGQDNSTLYQKK